MTETLRMTIRPTTMIRFNVRMESETDGKGAVSKVGYFFDSPSSLKLSLYIART